MPDRADEPDGSPAGATLTRAGVGAGVRQLMPVALFVVPFGIAFGAAAVDRGLSAPLAVTMSAVVFAGASQFAALELWVAPLPLLTIGLTVLAVNARHLLLGASLAPWLLQLPPARRLVVLASLSDANWAHVLAARERGVNDAGLLLGSGLAMWAAWVLGTGVGALAGTRLGDLALYGLDVVMVAFLTATLPGQWRGRADLVPWGVAGAVALVGSRVLPEGWFIIAGALAGGLTGALRHGR